MVKRDNTGNIMVDEFENYFKAQVRQEGYMEILMYVPDTSARIGSVSSNDVLQYSNINAITNLELYSSQTIATLEENLWLLNGTFPNIVDGTKVNGYISNSMSNDNGEFETNPKINIQLSAPTNVENFSIMLNPSVPTAYPKQIQLKCYNINGELVGTFNKSIDGLNTLPSVVYELNINNVSKLEMEFIGTRYPHRRIRVSTLLFGKVISINTNDIIDTDFYDKTSFVPDTIPSRTFSFTLNNYEGTYNVDNPNNGYISLDKQTKVMFRTGYNVAGYETDDDGYVKFDDEGYPIVTNPYQLTEIEWDNWKELRLLNVSTNADESVTFECGSVLDMMDEPYTQDLYQGVDRTVGEIVHSLLSSQGLPDDIVEWSSDGIFLPSGVDTEYKNYVISVPLPEKPIREIFQLLAFATGSTLLIKDNGKIKFANLSLDKPETFTHNFRLSYRDVENIPAAEQLESISKLTDLSIPKYRSYVDKSEGVQEISTLNISSVNTEVTYSECLPTGAGIAEDDTSGATVQNVTLYNKRGIVTLGGLLEGRTAKVVIYGYPIVTETIQERNVTNNTLVLDTELIKADVNSWNANGTIKQTEMIKRKYLEWYKKKFKYNITTRGEPLIDAGDYAIIQTQFSKEMPTYILSNHWKFDGTWSGDMEVIALGN